MQDVSSADGVAVDHRYDRLRQPPYLHLYVEDVEPRHTILAYVSATSFDMHVATGAESLVTGTGEDDHTYVEMVAAVGEGLAHLPHRQRREGVAVAWSVDGNLRDVVVFLKEYLLEVETLYCFPFSFHNIYV